MTGDESVQRMEFMLTLRRRGIADQAVLRAMDEVPREHFVDTRYADFAYADQAMPIACGQTISQPYVVAYMTEHLGVRPTGKDGTDLAALSDNRIAVTPLRLDLTDQPFLTKLTGLFPDK